MRQLHEEMHPYFERTGEQGTFTGAEGVTIAHVSFMHPGARTAIVFAPGRTEGSHTFMQLLYDLRDLPYDVHVIDHRGQGASGRLLEDPLSGHVDRFDNYVIDYAQFVRDVVKPERYDRVVGAGHSMGSAISLRYAMENPGSLDELILSAPMLEMNFGVASEELALAYASSVAPHVTLPDGAGGSDPAFLGNYLTNDPHQFDLLYETDNLYPERRVRAATYGWLAESIRATQYIRAHASLVTLPVLMFQAGSDGVVNPAAQTAFCAAVSDCELVTFPDARHELYFAESSTRLAIMERVVQQLAQPAQ